MKKQALAFLTLFSLILMLSVYYVTLPSDVTSVMSDTAQEEQDADAQGQQTQPEETSAAMQEEIAARMSEKLNEAQAVMADSASGEAEKEAALQTIEENETISQLQQQMIDHLKEKGWDCAVEISDGVCRVTLFGQEEAKETVTQVMNETYSVLNGNYLIEVAFKSA